MDSPNILETGRAKAEEFNGEGGPGFNNSGRLNVYECDGKSAFNSKPGCGAHIVTIDRHPGVTPFGVKCGRCGQTARSKGYRVADWLEPTHEWYRPKTLEGVEPTYYEHLEKGGLILRAIPGKPDKWSAPIDTLKDDMDRQAEKLLAMKRELERVDMHDKAEVMTRQMRRQSERKGHTPPATIQMYGRVYRLIEAKDHPNAG